MLGPTPETPLHRLERVACRWLPPRGSGEPFAQWLLGLTIQLPDPVPLAEALEIHQRLRFDPAPTASADVERLAGLTRTLEIQLKRTRKAVAR